MSVRMRVYDSRIYALNFPPHMIYRWSSRFTREVAAYARVFCPMAVQDWGTTSQRSNVPGRLKASHSVHMSANQFGNYGDVENTAPYAKWVHEGTSSPITAKGRGWVVMEKHPHMRPYMRFNINGHSYRKERVMGQSSKPWLANAASVIARSHGFR